MAPAELFPLWMQTVQQAAEPFTLTAIVFAFAGIAALFLINLTVKNDRKLDQLSRDFNAHTKLETHWQARVEKRQEEMDERHAGNYDNLLRNFRETKDAMMKAVTNRPKNGRHGDQQ